MNYINNKCKYRKRRVQNKINQYLNYIDKNYELSSKDFYPAPDNRFYTSNIEDVEDGDSFQDYVEWFYETYEEDLFD